jgi:hypothetical protein
VGKPGGKRRLGRQRQRWVHNVKMGLGEMRCGYVDWIGLAQDKDMCSACEIGNEPLDSIKY